MIVCIKNALKDECTKKIKQTAPHQAMGEEITPQYETVRQDGLCVQSLHTQTLKESARNTTDTAAYWKLRKSPIEVLRQTLQPVSCTPGGES